MVQWNLISLSLIMKFWWRLHKTLGENDREGTCTFCASTGAIPLAAATMFLWEIITPLGTPVDPEVYIKMAVSSGVGTSP